MRQTLLAVAAATVLAAGCFPVLLDVNQKGQVLIPRQEGVFSYDLASGKIAKIAARTKGDPAWARWSPDSSKILVAEQTGDSETALLAVNASDGKAKPLAEFGAVACAFWSPDAKFASVALADMNGVTLKKVDVASGSVSTLLAGALASHQWLPDGKVAALRQEGDVEESNLKVAALVVIDPAGGEPRKVAAIQCEQGALFDVSPDGTQALVVDTTVKAENEAEARLVKIAIADGTKKDLGLKGVKAAFWSPDGTHIAVVKTGAMPEGAVGEAIGKGVTAFGGPDGDKPHIVITDAEGKNPVVVAANVMTQTEGMSGVGVYPTWADAKTLLIFEQAKSYGVAGKAMHLVRVAADGSSREDLQYTIESGVMATMKK